MPSAVPPDQCHVRPRVVFLSPRSPFTLNHPVVFHFQCHFTSPLIVSSVLSPHLPQSVFSRAPMKKPPSPAFHPTLPRWEISLLFYFNGFFLSVKWLCVLSSLFCLLEQENSSKLDRFYAPSYLKLSFCSGLHDFIFQQSRTKTNFWGFLLSVLQQRHPEKQIQRDQGTVLGPWSDCLESHLCAFLVSNGMNTSHYKGKLKMWR